MIAGANRELQIALRYRLAMLSLLYRYLICLYWMGVLTAFSMAAFFIYQSTAVTSALLFK